MRTPNWDKALADLQKPQGNDACAAVIHFVPGTTEAKAKKFLQECVKRGIITNSECHEYNSRTGSPVWYIP